MCRGVTTNIYVVTLIVVNVIVIFSFDNTTTVLVVNYDIIIRYNFVITITIVIIFSLGRISTIYDSIIGLGATYCQGLVNFIF